MKIGLGADPFGVELKEQIKHHLEERGFTCVDLGGSAEEGRSYYEVADDLGSRVTRGELDRGVLICGTGMGMAIIANKHPGVYAAVCEDPTAAARARSINNANVVTLGGMITAAWRGREIVDTFLETEFKSGWDEDIRTFLDQSMNDIEAIERRRFKGETD
jgi:ribose 5-phosphate isomerase B